MNVLQEKSNYCLLVINSQNSVHNMESYVIFLFSEIRSGHVLGWNIKKKDNMKEHGDTENLFSNPSISYISYYFLFTKTSCMSNKYGPSSLPQFSQSLIHNYSFSKQIFHIKLLIFSLALPKVSQYIYQYW